MKCMAEVQSGLISLNIMTHSRSQAEAEAAASEGLDGHTLDQQNLEKPKRASSESSS